MRDLAEYRVIRRRPDPRELLRARVRVQPAALDGRGADRARRAAPRPARHRRPAGQRRGDGAARRGHARAGSRPRRRLRARALPGRRWRGGSSATASSRRLRRRARRRLPELQRGTTHISVVDGRGNAASLTASTGSGSGVIVPGTGIQLNNMLGEFDLTSTGGIPRPGVRFTSGMAPTIVLREGRPRLVVGSAGSLRLRGRSSRSSSTSSGTGSACEEAIERPRVHLDEPHVHCEGGNDPAELDRLESCGYQLARWRRRNLFFGGVAGVELREDGTPRRGRRPAPRRARRRDRVSSFDVRPSRPGRCRRAGRARAGGGQRAGRLADLDRRVAQRCRRAPLSALRPAERLTPAVFVAVSPEGLVGRLSVARDPHPASFHVADLGLMVAATHRRRGIGRALLEAAVDWAREVGVTKLELHVFPYNEPAIGALRELRLQQRGLPQGALPPGRRARGRDPDGLRGDAYTGRDERPRPPLRAARALSDRVRSNPQGFRFRARRP